MQQEQAPTTRVTKELIETFKDKTPEEITSYLYKRLEESHALMPCGIRGNVNPNTNPNNQGQCATELSRIISGINAEATPEYSADTDARFARVGVLDAPEDLELRECMSLLGVLPVLRRQRLSTGVCWTTSRRSSAWTALSPRSTPGTGTSSPVPTGSATAGTPTR